MQIDKTVWAELTIVHPGIFVEFINPPSKRVRKFENYRKKLSQAFENCADPERAKIIRQVIDTLCKFSVRPIIVHTDEVEKNPAIRRNIGIELEKRSPNRLFPILSNNRLRQSHVRHAICIANIYLEVAGNVPPEIFKRKKRLEQIFNIRKSEQSATFDALSYNEKAEIVKRTEKYVSAVLRLCIKNEASTKGATIAFLPNQTVQPERIYA